MPMLTGTVAWRRLLRMATGVVENMERLESERNDRVDD